MKRLFLFIVANAPMTAMAADFDRPIPQAQSATAEIWFAGASLALIAALAMVARLVARR
ncbi:protein NnrT [Lentibacter algarum]|uniref:protein NnrT n=1 Tax=Lentibacter algarum TaxID=576131 RepID=UPI001C072406|nr:protein NnrT [Lentibacter algarum]